MSKDVIRIVTPQFTRTADMPPVKEPPSDWQALRKMTSSELKALGMGVWSTASFPARTALMLLPGEWYAHIPDGYAVETINGKTSSFRKGKTDNDIRFGCLAYGIRVAHDGFEKDEGP